MANRWTTRIQHHPVRKQFQCKHIPDEMMVEAILSIPGSRSDWRMRWDVEEVLRIRLGDAAPIGLAKVMMAKFAKMERRGILHGCSCGCRGDYHLPDGVCC